MRIEETLLTKKIIIETDDPYGLAMELMDFASRFGKVIERVNRYETDGPARKTALTFELVENVDRASHAIVEFLTQGETNNVNYLEIDITGRFVSELDINGFFSSTFAEYYLKHLFPRYLKSADEKMKHLDKSVSEFANSVRKSKKELKT